MLSMLRKDNLKKKKKYETGEKLREQVCTFTFFNCHIIYFNASARPQTPQMTLCCYV